jgi:hypothetical protein
MAIPGAATVWAGPIPGIAGLRGPFEASAASPTALHARRHWHAGFVLTGASPGNLPGIHALGGHHKPASTAQQFSPCSYRTSWPGRGSFETMGWAGMEPRRPFW